MKQGITRTLGCDYLRARQVQSFLDIPDNVRVDAIAFGGKQLTPDAREHERPQDLKAVDCARKVRCRPFNRAVQGFQALHRSFTDAGNLWIDAAQTEICAEADTPGWSPTAHACLESAGQDRT